jgi:hypothetical protein
MALVREYLLFSIQCKSIKRFYYAQKLVLSSFWRQGSHMRAAPVLTLLVIAQGWAGEAFGVWKLDPARSTLAGNQKSATLRIEPHTRGEVFTLDTVAVDGRTSTSSTILYFDGKARDFHDSACSGTQSSRRLDSRTVEILRACANGEHSRLIRRLTSQPGVLILEIIEQHTDGRRSERRLVMEKQ